MTKGAADEIRITAVIPAYNVEHLIGRAIQSVLDQAWPPDEIVVVDDGSADGTPEVVRGFGQPVRLIRQANAGVAAARNRGIQDAKGEWIAFLDADDRWEPHRLAAQVRVLERHPELVWVAGGLKIIRPGEDVVFWPVGDAYKALLVADCLFPSFYAAAVAGARFHTDAMLIRRDVLFEVGLFDPGFQVGEDLDLWFRIADRYPQIGYVEGPVCVYEKQPGTSLMLSKAYHPDDVWRLCEKHLGFQCEKVDLRSWKARWFGHVVAVRTKRAGLAGDPRFAGRMAKAFGRVLPLRFRMLGWAFRWLPPGLCESLIEHLTK